MTWLLQNLLTISRSQAQLLDMEAQGEGEHVDQESLHVAWQ